MVARLCRASFLLVYVFLVKMFIAFGAHHIRIMIKFCILIHFFKLAWNDKVKKKYKEKNIAGSRQDSNHCVPGCWITRARPPQYTRGIYKLHDPGTGYLLIFVTMGRGNYSQLILYTVYWQSNRLLVFLL